MNNLNGGQYAEPDAPHLYIINAHYTDDGEERWLHVPGCYRLDPRRNLFNRSEEWTGALPDASVDVLCGCIPNVGLFVDLPDGQGRRYAPYAADAFTHAVVVRSGVSWAVETWEDGLSDAQFTARAPQCQFRDEVRILQAETAGDNS